MTLSIILSFVAFLRLRWVPSVPLSGELFFISYMDVKFYQKVFFFHIYWDDHMVSILQFVNVVYHITYICIYWTIRASLLVQRVKNLPETQLQRHKRCRFDPWPERFPGERNGKQHWYSCLKNPMNRGSSCSIVHGVTKSWTWLNHWT